MFRNMLVGERKAVELDLKMNIILNGEKKNGRYRPQSAIDQRKLNEEVDFAKIVAWLARTVQKRNFYIPSTVMKRL
jgi:hypothetical protein